MRILAGLLMLAAACSGPKAKPESPLVNEGSAASENCCCKSNPLTSEDGKPVYEASNRMECSTNKGECVPEVQCQKSDPPPPPGSAP